MMDMKQHILTRPIPRSWESPIKQWLDYLKALGRRERTISTRRRHIRLIAREMKVDPCDVTEDQLLQWCAGRQWATETRVSYYSSIRGFFEFWSRKSGCPDPSAVLGHPKRRVPPPRPVPRDIVRTAYAQANARGKLVIALATCLGLRACEIALVHMRDIFLDGEIALLYVHGKGDKERAVPLQDWLATELMATCAANGGYAFPGQINGHLAVGTITNIASEILPKGYSLHQLRHTYATSVYAADKDLLTLRDLLGHASVATTQRYAKPPEASLEAALQAADIRNY